MLEQVDLNQKFDVKKEYKKALKREQIKLLHHQQEFKQIGLPAIFVFEGWDAAGKGGAIKRLTERLDPRGFEVHAISAPTDQELRYHYLHRFWTRLPYNGKIGIFDRSWYGRVLVERVEQFASEEEWERAYDEIKAFEKMLADGNYLIQKFWLHISKDEQLRRFNERMENPLKRWKITDEDWRNREKWDAYETAVEDMVKRTSTEYAPWHIIASQHKWHARVQTLKVINEAMERHLAKQTIQ